MLTRVIARMAVAVTAIAAGAVVLALPAHAQQEVVCSSDGYGGQICLLVVVVNTDGGWTVEVQHQSGGETQIWCVRPKTGHYVTCRDQYGWYNAESDCYITPGGPSDHEPLDKYHNYEAHGEDGLVYMGVCFGDGTPIVGEIEGRTVNVLPPHTAEPVVLGPNPDGYGGTPSPLPDLIEEAINSLEMTGADIRMAPNPDGAGLVGLPVWMATTVSEQTWGPQSRSAPETGTVQGVSVTADAQAQSILWDMGNGDERTCANPGTVYDPSYGVTESPTCGYPGYREPSRSLPGGTYPITATTTWTIAWTSTEGAGGDFEVTTGSTTAVRINELQVLTTFE